MVIPLFVTVVVVSIIAYLLLKALGEIGKGLFLLLIVVLIYWAFTKSMPNGSQLPLIGSFSKIILNSINTSLNIKNFLYKIKIISLDKSSDGHLLILIENKGLLPVSNYSVLIDDKKVEIINQPKQPLYPKEVTTIEVDWKKQWKTIEIKTGQTTALISCLPQ